MGNYGITLLGLGPGDPGCLTRHAWQLLENCSEVYLRTAQHPVVAGLPAHLRWHSFDDLYERFASFQEVYAAIVESVLELARRPEGVVYAVPGSPFVGEATTLTIAERARSEGIQVQIVEGLSFLEPTFSALGVDPLPHTALVDALEISSLHIPPFPPHVPAIIAQLHSSVVASDVKLTLGALYPDEHPVKLIHAAGTPQQRVEDLRLFEIDRSPFVGLLTSLYVPPLATGASFEEFLEVIAHLRAPNGCPWDREQTHLSLRPYLLEETYEVLAALDAENPRELMEELGDLLLQIVLHAQIAAENGDFTMADVLQYIHHKIVHRHPHVFGEVNLKDAQEVLLNWERLKAEERLEHGKSEASLLDGVSPALPALVQAEQYQLRTARVGFDWQDIRGVFQQMQEELQEIKATSNQQQREDEVGDLLFAVVSLARKFGIDPESALRQTNLRFKKRFAHLEAEARAQGRAVSDLSIAEMQSLWEKVKTLDRDH